MGRPSCSRSADISPSHPGGVETPPIPRQNVLVRRPQLGNNQPTLLEEMEKSDRSMSAVEKG